MEQSSDVVTFKMRPGKKVEYGFYIVWLLLMAAFGIFLSKPMNGENMLSAVLLMILFTGFPLAGVIIFLISIICARLEFSKHGLTFQNIKSFHASWDEVKGFNENNGEIYMRIERLEGNKPVKRNLPLTWFTKMRLDQKPYKSEVLEYLKIFAPKLFNITEEVDHNT